MKFKIDENLPVEVAERLKLAGHDAATVLAQKLVGKPDEDLAAICQQEGRIIITLDLDFADIRAYPPGEFVGAIVLRLQQQDKMHVLHVLEPLLESLKTETPEKKLWIVDEHRIRIRE